MRKVNDYYIDTLLMHFFRMHTINDLRDVNVIRWQHLLFILLNMHMFIRKGFVCIWLLCCKWYFIYFICMQNSNVTFIDSVFINKYNDLDNCHLMCCLIWLNKKNSNLCDEKEIYLFIPGAFSCMQIIRIFQTWLEYVFKITIQGWS